MFAMLDLDGSCSDSCMVLVAVMVVMVYFSPDTRHKSFKLRLPSIRRDLRKNAKGDVENPPDAEESVPLHRLSPPGDGSSYPCLEFNRQLLPSPPTEKRFLERELSDFSNFSNDDRRSRKSSQGSLRKASSLEHLERGSRSPVLGNNRKSGTISSGWYPHQPWNESCSQCLYSQKKMHVTLTH